MLCIREGVRHAHTSSHKDSSYVVGSLCRQQHGGVHRCQVNMQLIKLLQVAVFCEESGRKWSDEEYLFTDTVAAEFGPGDNCSLFGYFKDDRYSRYYMLPNATCVIPLLPGRDSVHSEILFTLKERCIDIKCPVSRVK